MENNRTDRQPRTVDFSLFDQIEKAVPAYDLDKAIQKRDYRIDLTQHYADAEYLLTVDGIGMLAKGDIQAVKGKAKQGKTFFITALVAAVLNRNAADSIPERFSEVTDWYIGGHSLGGAMAASYAAKHTDELDGLVLLAAYSTADLTDSGLRVYSTYGSEDGVLNREKYEADRTNLPQDTTETVIDGGCHAGFGSYGAQKGDGTPTISAEEQQRQTADALAAWMNLQ